MIDCLAACELQTYVHDAMFRMIRTHGRGRDTFRYCIEPLAATAVSFKRLWSVCVKRNEFWRFVHICQVSSTCYTPAEETLAPSKWQA